LERNGKNLKEGRGEGMKKVGVLHTRKGKTYNERKAGYCEVKKSV